MNATDAVTMQLSDSKKTWEVPQVAIRKVACDLITTAVEGGIGYWSTVSDYQWGDPDLGQNRDPGREDWTPEDGPYVYVIVYEDGDPPAHPVDEGSMVKVLAALVEGKFEPFWNRPSYSTTYRARVLELLDELAAGTELSYTDYDYDAGDADAMMQLAVLGEIRYG